MGHYAQTTKVSSARSRVEIVRAYKTGSMPSMLLG